MPRRNAGHQVPGHALRSPLGPERSHGGRSDATPGLPLGSLDRWQRIGQDRVLGRPPVVQPSGVEQAAVTLGNVDDESAASPSPIRLRAEVQALHDKCEELADDVRALATLVHALRGGARLSDGGG